MVIADLSFMELFPQLTKNGVSVSAKEKQRNSDGSVQSISAREADLGRGPQKREGSLS